LNKPGSRMKYKDIRDIGRTTTNVTDLEKYTEYIFQVLAYTIKDGSWSEQVIRRTKEDGVYEFLFYQKSIIKSVHLFIVGWPIRCANELFLACARCIG